MAARTTALMPGAILAAGMAATPVHAAVISYTEGADLSGASGTPTVLGALGNGANIIHGTINCSSGCSTGDLDDYFNVTLSSVQQITNISLSITNFSQSNGAIGVANMNGSAITPISFSKNVNNGANNTTTSLYAGSAPGPGTQSCHVGLSGGDSSNRGSASPTSLPSTSLVTRRRPPPARDRPSPNPRPSPFSAPASSRLPGSAAGGGPSRLGACHSAVSIRVPVLLSKRKRKNEAWLAVCATPASHSC